jgi:nitrogen regulatory protein PII
VGHGTLVPIFHQQKLIGRFAVALNGEFSLKLVIAIIQPTKLSAVREALEEIVVLGLTICAAQGFGAQLGPATKWHAGQPESRMLRKIALEIVVNDDFLDRTIETIENIARTGTDGNIGDGKILVLPAEEAIQIDDSRRGQGSV